LNQEPVAGLFNISFRTGGPGGGGRSGQGISMIGTGGGGRGQFSIAFQGRGMEAADISKVVFIGPNEARKIGIVLDAQPRAMIINTLFSRNIPGEINMPVNDIIKSKSDTKAFEGEEILGSMPKLFDPSEIIVDNEDSGFISSKLNMISPLKRLLGISNPQGTTYMEINPWWAPEYWQPVVQNSYYGKYIRSSVYTRSGTGDKTVTWQAILKEPGYYDVYCYIGKAIDRMRVRAGRGPGQGGPGGGGGQMGPSGAEPEESPYKDMHYKIYHDEGVDEITLDYENAEGGWNSLGRYYMSPDTAKVILSNKSSGKMVIGDAIKWVKQN
jgi:hypothetical protein